MYDGDSLETMTIEITKKCNFRCKFCFASSNKVISEEQYVDDDKLNRVIEQIKKNNLYKVTITGGEPFVDIELFERLVYKLSENNITINLNTNLSLVNKDNINLIEKYIEKDFYIFTSLLSPIAVNCDKITGIKGSFISVTKAIRLCKMYGIRLSVNFTISKDNIDDISSIKEFAKINDIDRVSISMVIPPSYDRKKYQNELSNKEIMQIADALVEIHNDLGVSVATSHPIPLCIIGKDSKYDVIESQRCRTGYNYCALNLQSGSVFACSQEEKIYGNIYHEDLDYIVTRMQREHMDMNLNNKCLECDLLSRCGGTCKWSGCNIC
jgi:radical SAM protein with 4Fe4S-binding SPASM domain